jgi:low temperature requirement protein LtrA
MQRPIDDDKPQDAYMSSSSSTATLAAWLTPTVIVIAILIAIAAWYVYTHHLTLKSAMQMIGEKTESARRKLPNATSKSVYREYPPIPDL